MAFRIKPQTPVPPPIPDRQVEVCTRSPATSATWKGTGVLGLCFHAARKLPCLPPPLSVGLRSGRSHLPEHREPQGASPQPLRSSNLGHVWEQRLLSAAADPGWEAAGTSTSTGHVAPCGSHGHSGPSLALPRSTPATTELLNFLTCRNIRTPGERAQNGPCAWRWRHEVDSLGSSLCAQLRWGLQELTEPLPGRGVCLEVVLTQG